MKLWLISQDKNTDWDTFDSAVVAAESEEVARHMNPYNGEPVADWAYRYSSWAPAPEFVEVKLIGEAVEGTETGVICASFNAG